MSKTTVIYHSADFDGIFCREIARKFLPEAELIGWDYGQPVIKLPDEGIVYVLDLSPDCVEFDEERTPEPAKLIWIDHHKTAIDKFAPTIPGYRIDGVAACRLAWQWFYHRHEFSSTKHVLLATKDAFLERGVDEPYAVRLAGEYDVWDKRDERAEAFQFGLRSRELNAEDWKAMFSERDVITDQLIHNGYLLQNYQQRNDAGMMARSFLVDWEGLKFLALNTARCNSLTFAAKDVAETGHDALLGFYWTGAEFTVSLYHAKHATDLDLSVIAKKYGGGGHRGACGFRAKTLPWVNGN